VVDRIEPIPQRTQTVVIGYSARGRAITALHRWRPGAPNRVLVVGSIHGDEPAGHGTIHMLSRSALPYNVDLWLVRTVNPDGVVARTRKNARGVDLNRNFPHSWARTSPSSRTYGGPSPASEPETRALLALTQRIRPDITVVMHQPLFGVDNSYSKRPEVPRDLSRLSGLPLKTFSCGGVCHGTYTSWHNRYTPGVATTLEFGPTASVHRQQLVANAIMWVARYR
jgi:predicted deacylase